MALCPFPRELSISFARFPKNPLPGIRVHVLFPVWLSSMHRRNPDFMNTSPNSRCFRSPHGHDLARFARPRRSSLLARLPRRDLAGRCDRQRARGAGGRQRRCRCANSRSTSFGRAPGRPRPACNSPASPSGRPGRPAPPSISAMPSRSRAGCSRTTRSAFSWSAPRLLFPKNRVKLLLNLIMIAITAIPRGGSISASVVGRCGELRVHPSSRRASMRAFPPMPRNCSPDSSETGTVDAHGIQIYYAGEVARAAGHEHRVQHRRRRGDDPCGHDLTR